MRKETIVRIVADGKENRDDGREFLIIEMSAIKAEKWAAKALLAITSSGGDIGEDVDLVNGGIEALSIVGIKAFMGLKFEYIEPLLDEMLECCHYIRTPGDTTSRQQLTIQNCETYIEEVTTLLKLRTETLSLHLGFSLAGKLSKFQQGQEEKTAENLSTTEIPPATSEQSFQEDWQQKKS